MEVHEKLANGTKACGKVLGKVSIRSGIFQGLSPLLFVICMIPLTTVLRKARVVYIAKYGNLRVNHLFFMDDLKLFGKSEKEVDGLVSTVQLTNKNIGMECGIKKWGMVVMKRGQLRSAKKIVLPDGEMIRKVNKNGYKYLGILELDRIKVSEMKKKFGDEYLRRFRLMMKSRLNGKNRIKAENTWVVSVMRYGAGILKWTNEELKALDARTRKVMTMNEALHPKSDLERIYLPRKKGGGGLISCKACVKSEENSLGWYIKGNDEPILKAVVRNGTIETEATILPQECNKKNSRQGEEVGGEENVWTVCQRNGQRS